MDQRDCIASAGRLRLELSNETGERDCTRCIIGTREHGEIASVIRDEASDGLPSIATDRGEQLDECRLKAPDLFFVEMLPLKIEYEPQLTVEAHADEQGIVAGLQDLRPARTELAVLRPQDLIDRIVLKHQDIVEQRPSGPAGQPLDIGERLPAMLAQGEIALLQLPQPGTDFLLRMGVIDDRQRVDEKAYHLLGPGEAGRPVGHSDAEAHRVLASMPSQQLRPRGLNDRVEGHPLAGRKLLQARAEIRVHRHRERAVASDIARSA